ncbi:MAG: serine/threonine-protein phosphatase [Ruminococcaceae bacterium]|nr:serine/threonine-protein phosphatase [Oscillospiraceae bacterium]
MSIEYSVYTNIGDCAINEDFASAFEGSVSAYVLADGLGGHGGGDIASHLVVEAVKEIVSQASELSVALLDTCFTVAQEKLLARQKELNREGALKTTLVILLTDGKTAIWGHIGDSRLYHCRKGKVQSRTLDHSVPQMLVKLRQIKEKDIRHHEERNVLLKVMGIPWSESKMYDIDCTGMKLKKGDSFIMCSDGCWEWVEDSDIAKIICQKKAVDTVAGEIGDEAYSNGMGTDRDNITALVVRIN